MNVQTDKVPPLPQLVPPMRSIEIKPAIDLTKLRFDNAWMQWFTQVKYKIDTINANLVGVAALAGSGIVSRDISGNWLQLTIQGTANRIAVANGDGVSGNITINIDPNYAGQTTITQLGTIATGTWQGTAVGVSYGGTGATNPSDARDNLGAAAKMTTSSTSATGGAATALPAQPVGYVTVDIAGTPRKIAYYDP